MSEGTPQPRYSRASEVPGPFNVESMTDEELGLLGRALYRAATDANDSKEEQTLDRIWHTLVKQIGETAARDIARAKRLLGALAISDDERDQFLAVAATPTVARYDYVLAQDTLVSVYRHPSGLDVFGDIASVLGKIESELPPDQRAESVAMWEKLEAERRG